MVSVPRRAPQPRSGRAREPDVESYPWLESVSEDRTTWTVRNVGSARKQSVRISLDIEFEDGTQLPDPENHELFDIAVEYLQLVRLHQPILRPDIHIGRVRGLLAFFYWLNGRSIRSLADVAPDHIALFTKECEFGRDWIARGPHRLIRFVQRQIAERRALPLAKDNRLDLARIREQAKLGWPVSSNCAACAKIARWLEAHSLKMDTEKAPEALIAEHGWRPKRQTIHNIHRSLLPIEELWRWREQFSMSVLSFNPFPEGASVNAARMGVEPQRHPTVPPAIAFPYLRGALRWVVEYAPVIREARAKECSAAVLEERLARVGSKIELTDAKQARNTKKVTPDGLTRLTAAACFAVIAGLSARRLSEIADLGAGCSCVDNDGRHWLRIYIAKTMQECDQIPIPAAVHEAVRCMETISEDARKSTGTDAIWQFRAIQGNMVIRLRPQQELNNLTRHLDTEVSPDWKFSAHQLRRFFAMLYFWRYEKGDVAGLAHHLRHLDLEMTRRYVSDNQFGKIWTDVEDEWRGDFLRAVVEGSKAIGGAAGERIKEKIEKMRRRYRKDVDVVARKRVVAKLLRLAKKWGVAGKLHVWGTICVCPQRASARFAKHAKCKGSGETGPVFSQATEDTCACCPFAVHTEHFKGAAEDALSARTALADGLSDGALIRGFVESSCEQIERGLSVEATRAPPAS